ncbi:flagellar hook-associated protein 3 [Xylophilus rhododendri]|uniref:Flagellar hook-associated protein 3 n=1 Tax=Xylophilus rhododendri TaxID=2697032 RepID=A0A857J4N2_9BURK|nr:flagellar hook-associated protein FlgL [Xylophilus rhododendri]QHI97991.1 flagellar hook-associated protein 3 [Xylophilus rhododendri]
MSTSRIGTASAYAGAVQNLSDRQQALVTLQQNMTSGKRINRTSDDPTSAAQAERANTRIDRIAADQRLLASQRDTISTAESTLGSSIDALQSFRELVVSAGSGTLTPADRGYIAQQLTSLRDEIFANSNKSDSNGTPLFSGLGSADQPFTNTQQVNFAGLSGQRTGGATTVAPTLDGQATFMNVPTGNGTFTLATGTANTGTVSVDAGSVQNPSAITGHNYTIGFAVDATTGVKSYTVTDTTAGTTAATGTYKESGSISFDGMTMTMKGTPADGDTVAIAPSTRSDLFATLDQAISSIKNATSNSGALPTQIAQSLVQIDSGLSRLQSSRSLAGDILNQADRIKTSQDTRSDQLTAEKSNAEDLDMIKAVSEFSTQQTGYQAALSSYAQIQKLSLFTYIS